MNKILIIASLLIVACSDNAAHLQPAKEAEQEEHKSASFSDKLKLNNNAKWRTDDATKENVVAMTIVINDSNNVGYNRSEQLVKQMQSRIDALLQQCKMKGADHDALHLWLELVMRDLKNVRASDEDGYQKSYAALKRDVESFDVYFE
jgi:hypothetical protein